MGYLPVEGVSIKLGSFVQDVPVNKQYMSVGLGHNFGVINCFKRYGLGANDTSNANGGDEIFV